MGEPNQVRESQTQYNERPAFWMRNASQSFFWLWPDRVTGRTCSLRNCLRELKTAHEKGQPIDELSPVWETHRLPPEDDLREVWLSVAACIENEAVIALPATRRRVNTRSVAIQVP